jgi:ribosomal protein S10
MTKCTVAKVGVVKHTSFHVGAIEYDKVQNAVGKQIVSQVHGGHANVLEPRSDPHRMLEIAVCQTSIGHAHLRKRDRFPGTIFERKEGKGGFCEIGARQYTS